MTRFLLHGGLMCLLIAGGLGCRYQPKPPGGTEPRSASIRILVAASTRQAVEEIARGFTERTGVKVEVSPGPSSGLAKQIDQGAPADLFLSADQASADYVASRALDQVSRVLLKNRLVVVVPADSTVPMKELNDLAGAGVKRLALAEEKVPAGEYAREALRKAGVWDRVKDRVVGGSDVRVTLQLVEKGADAGLVYLTDTVGNTNVRVAFEIDAGLHKPIEYPLMLIRNATIKPEAVAFYEHLSSDLAAAVFEKAKFVVVR